MVFFGTPKTERSRNLAAAHQPVTKVIVRLVEFRREGPRPRGPKSIDEISCVQPWDTLAIVLFIVTAPGDLASPERKFSSAMASSAKAGASMDHGPFSLRIVDERGLAIELLHPRRKVAGVEDGFCGTPKTERSQNLAAAQQRFTKFIVPLVERRTYARP